MGIWSLSGSTATLEGRTTTFTGNNGNPQTVHLALESPVCLVSGTDYLLGVCCNDTDTSWGVTVSSYLGSPHAVRHHSGMSTDLSDFSTSSDTTAQNDRDATITGNNSSTSF